MATVNMSRNTVNLVQEDSGQREEKVVAKTPVQVQRMKLAKLMSNPGKIVPIPERPKEKTMASPADFVRNVMGSSAGAGSGEFHVYRRIRRRECTREKLMSEKSEKELKDEEFQRQMEEKKKALEEKTAKKRQKRLKKKQKAKDLKKLKVEPQGKPEESESEESDED